MADLKNSKLNDEELEQVTGGTSAETQQIIDLLFEYGIVKREAGLNKEKLLRVLSVNKVHATLKTGKKNSYTYKGDPLTHEGLIKLIENGEIVWAQD